MGRLASRGPTPRGHMTSRRPRHDTALRSLGQADGSLGRAIATGAIRGEVPAAALGIWGSALLSTASSISYHEPRPAGRGAGRRSRWGRSLRGPTAPAWLDELLDLGRRSRGKGLGP